MQSELKQALLLSFAALLATTIAMAGDRQESPVTMKPLPHPRAAIPEQQTEPHTCGLHAMSSMYRAYGLDPEACRLRARVGADARSVSFVKDTEGTVQPDILRVLAQDAFDATRLDLYSRSVTNTLVAHLNQNQYALGLIKRKENSHLHWILLTGCTTGYLSIVDSLQPEPYTEELGPFLRTNLLSVVLVTPRSEKSDRSMWSAHWQGLKEMVNSWRRK